MPETIREKTRIIYIHGFNSSPDSQKAQSFSHYCNLQGLKDSISIPLLPYDPAQAIKVLESIIRNNIGHIERLVGSSLGGYFATYLADKYTLRAVLINPAVAPYKNLNDEFLGEHKNMYTGEVYEITMQHVKFLKSLEIKEQRHPENYLLMVQTADEVLDYRVAVDKYFNSRQIIQQGGDHSFVNFESMLPEIFNFAGLLIH